MMKQSTKRTIAEAEQSGLVENFVADSLEYRKSLMEKVRNREISLQEAQRQLSIVQKNAKANGLKTRDTVYREAM